MSFVMLLALNVLQQCVLSLSIPPTFLSCFYDSSCTILSYVRAHRQYIKGTKQVQSSRKYDSFRDVSVDGFSKASFSSHALSSTLPWTIPLSLAVLWGVCWMFYPADNVPPRTQNTDQEYAIDWDQIERSYQLAFLDTAPAAGSAQPEMVEAASSRFQDQLSDGVHTLSGGLAVQDSQRLTLIGQKSSRQRNLLAIPRQTRIATDRDLSPAGTHTLTERLASTDPSQARSLDSNHHTYGSHEPQDTNLLSDSSWLLGRGDIPSSHVLAAALPATSWVEPATYIRQEPQANVRRRVDSHSFHTNQQQVPGTFPQNLALPPRIAPSPSDPRLSPYLAQQLSNLDMIEDTAYPISPPSDGHSSRRTSSIDIRMSTNEQTPEASRAFPQTFKRDRTPPRNSKDEIFCDHPDCTGKREIFNRACEWNKHMDKHERPYKCLERGCERLLGFTYSGGLLRHNREVHKKNLSTRTPLYCPFRNCNRNLSSGHGFTRQENLNEHKRRRHPGEEPPVTPNQVLSPWPADAGHKRKRTLDSVDEDEQESEDEELTDEETSPMTKRSRTTSDGKSQQVVEQLRAEIRKRDELIARQGAHIESLRTTLQSLQPPPPTTTLRGPTDNDGG